MPGSRPDQVGMPEVWFMVKVQDIFFLYILGQPAQLRVPIAFKWS